MTRQAQPTRCPSQALGQAPEPALRQLLGSGLVLLLILAGCGDPEGDGGATQPNSAGEARNLVLVVLDTVRPDHLGVYGHGRATTPELDRFAADAVVFDNAQSSAPWTAPSLISLVTSLYPAVHGVSDFPNPARLSDGATTLAEVFEQAGADTAAFTEGGYAKGDFGLDRGFDLFPDNPGDHATHSSNLHAPSRLEGNFERASAWLDGRTDERPFFLLFHTYEAHEPYRAPERFVRLFRPDYDEAAEHERLGAAIERWNASGAWTRGDALLLGRHEPHCALQGLPPLQRVDELLATQRAFEGMSAAEVAEHETWMRDLYDAELRFTDEVLGKLWRQLERDGHLEDTAVVVVSDHGEGFGEHGHYGHGRLLFEELLRIALIVRAPGLPARRLAPLVRSVDVMPTLLDLFGLERSELALQGTSLASWLRGEAPAPELVSFSHGLSIPGEEGRLVSARVGPYRLVNVAGTRELALYDLSQDPGELTSVAGEKLDVARGLYERLERQAQRDAELRARLGEPQPLPPPSEDALRELEALGYIDGR